MSSVCSHQCGVGVLECFSRIHTPGRLGAGREVAIAFHLILQDFPQTSPFRSDRSRLARRLLGYLAGRRWISLATRGISRFSVYGIHGHVSSHEGNLLERSIPWDSIGSHDRRSSEPLASLDRAGESRIVPWEIFEPQLSSHIFRHRWFQCRSCGLRCILRQCCHGAIMPESRPLVARRRCRGESAGIIAV